MWILLVTWLRTNDETTVTLVTRFVRGGGGMETAVFDTLEAAKACARKQSMCMAYGALAVDVDSGVTEFIHGKRG